MRVFPTFCFSVWDARQKMQVGNFRSLLYVGWRWTERLAARRAGDGGARLLARDRTSLETVGAGEVEGDSSTLAVHSWRENLGPTPPCDATSAGVGGDSPTLSEYIRRRGEPRAYATSVWAGREGGQGLRHQRISRYGEGGGGRPEVVEGEPKTLKVTRW